MEPKGEQNAPKQTFLKDSTIYVSATVLSAVISFLTLPIYTRYLSPADYGVVALFIMFGSVLAGLLSLGLNTASYRYYFQFKEDREGFKILNSTNILFILCVYLLSGFFIFYLADWFSLSLFDGQISGKLLRLSFISGCLEYFFAYMTLLLTAQIRPITFSVITVSKILLNTIFSFYFIFVYSYTYLALIYATLFTQLIMVICLLILTRDLLGIRFSLSSLNKSIRFSYPNVPNSIISLIYSSFDKTMLNKYKGLTSLGYYTFGAKFANLMKMVMDSVGRTWGPFFMQKAHENTGEAKREIINRFFELAFIYMLGGLGIICFSEEMIKLLTTKEYYPAMYVIPIYVYFYLFGIGGQLATGQIMFGEKMLFLLPSNIVSIILNVSLNILLIPKFGAVGAVVATAIAALVASVFLLYFGLRAYPLPLGKRKLAGMYLLLMAFTVPIYPIMAAEMNFIVKIIFKIVIWVGFVRIGVGLNYISQERIKGFSKRIFHFGFLRFVNRKI